MGCYHHDDRKLLVLSSAPKIKHVVEIESKINFFNESHPLSVKVYILYQSVGPKH